MKGIDLETLFEVPARPIQGMQSTRHDLQGFGEIHPSRLEGFGDQSMLTQYPFDRGERRQRFACNHVAQLAPNGPCTDQAHFLFHQATSCLDNALHDTRRILGRCLMWATGMTVKTGNTVLLEPFLPFAQPRTTTTNLLQDLLPGLALQSHSDRLPAYLKFLFLVHALSLSEKA